MPSKIPVFCIDSYAIIYNILTNVGYYDPKSPGKVVISPPNVSNALKYSTLAIQWVHSLGFIAEKHRPKQAVVLWLLDSPLYWRSKIFPEYKGHRGVKHDFFWQIDANLRSIVPTFAIPSYEADDLAALYAKLWLTKSTSSQIGDLHLCTVDSDWMGLLSPGVVWMDLGGYAPRVRSHDKFYDQWLAIKISKLPKKHKAAVESVVSHDDPTSIWRYKQILGDRSDNLPPNCDHTLINLFLPPPAHRLWEQPAIVKLATNKLRMPPEFDFATTFETLRQMYLLGYEPPVKVITENITPIADLAISR